MEEEVQGTGETGGHVSGGGGEVEGEVRDHGEEEGGEDPHIGEGTELRIGGVPKEDGFQQQRGVLRPLSLSLIIYFHFIASQPTDLLGWLLFDGF